MTVRLLNRESDAWIFPEPLLLRFNPRQEIKGDLCNFLGKKKKFCLHSLFPRKIHRVSSKLRKTKASFQKNLKPLLLVSTFTWTACAWACQQNGDPLLKTLLHGAASGQKLHRVPLSHEKMWLIGPEFVTLNFKLFFLDFSLFGVAVQLHSNFFFHILCTKQTQTNTLEITGNTSACDHTVKSSDFVNYDYLKITQSNTLIILSCLNFLARAT